MFGQRAKQPSFALHKKGGTEGGENNRPRDHFEGDRLKQTGVNDSEGQQHEGKV